MCFTLCMRVVLRELLLRKHRYIWLRERRNKYSIVCVCVCVCVCVSVSVSGWVNGCVHHTTTEAGNVSERFLLPNIDRGRVHEGKRHDCQLTGDDRAVQHARESLLACHPTRTLEWGTEYCGLLRRVAEINMLNFVRRCCIWQFVCMGVNPGLSEGKI
jgi:hypothetical protein